MNKILVHVKDSQWKEKLQVNGMFPDQVSSLLDYFPSLNCVLIIPVLLPGGEYKPSSQRAGHKQSDLLTNDVHVKLQCRCRKSWKIWSKSLRITTANSPQNHFALHCGDHQFEFQHHQVLNKALHMYQMCSFQLNCCQSQPIRFSVYCTVMKN